ncbi:MAG TPA: MFS transporter [Streptosporangiaceae bacterium]
MTRRHRLILVLLLGAQFMLAADFSILNVALPAVGKGLGFSLANLQWIATAFALPAAGFTLLFGRVADLIGRRRLFLTGLALLVAASFVGGLAASPAMLLTARVTQGFATAITTPAALSLLTTSFPEGPLRERALGLNGALLSSGFTFGALFGGLLTDLFSWRWAFLINVPIGALILVAAPMLVGESRHPDRPRLDVPGAVTVTAGLLTLVYGITQAGRAGWGSRTAQVTLLAGVVLLVAFWLIERRAAAPLASITVLTRRTVTWGNVGGLLAFGMASATVFMMTVYLQQVLGYSPLVAGVALGVPGAAAFVSGLVSSRFIARIGSRRALIAGLLTQALPFMSLSLLGTHKSGVALVLGACGVGFFGHVLAIVAYTVTATSGLPNEEQGLATGLTTMTQQVALTLGIPVLSAIATARSHALAGTVSATDAVLGGIHAAILANVAITLVGVLLIGLFLRRTTVVR